MCEKTYDLIGLPSPSHFSLSPFPQCIINRKVSVLAYWVVVAVVVGGVPLVGRGPRPLRSRALDGRGRSLIV